MNALTLAKEIADEITGWRRDLHRIPEIGLNLPKTAAYVTAVWTRWAFPTSCLSDIPASWSS